MFKVVEKQNPLAVHVLCETRDYMEDLLACFPVTDKAAANIEAVKTAASAQGFHSFRIAGFVPGTRPNFAATIGLPFILYFLNMKA